MKLTRKSLIILAILLLGLFFRVYDLGNESMWIDESISVNVASKTDLSQIIKAKRTDLPLYHVILHYWIKLFNTSEFSTRFLSTIFGLLALFITYKLGCLIFDTEVGILSSLLLGLSVFHIQYSQEARMYSLVGFLTLLTMYFFIKLLKKITLIDSTGYVVLSALLISTHFFGPFIILSQNFYIFTLFFLFKEKARINLKRWFILQAILIISFAPWFGFLIERMLLIRQFSYWWIPKPTLASIAVSFLEYSGSLPLTLIFLTLLFLSIVTYRKLSGSLNFKHFFESVENYRWNIGIANIKNIYLLLVWLFFPIVLLYIISVSFIPIYWTRYTIGCSLPFYLLVAKGIRNINYKYAKLVIIILIIFFSLINISVYYREINKEQWREVAKYIDTNAQTQDLLVFNPGTGQVPFNYYFKRQDLVKNNFLTMYEVVDEENIKRLDALVGRHDRVWVVLSHSNDPKGLIKDYFNGDFNLLFSEKYMRARFINLEFPKFINKYDVGIEVYLFKKRKAGSNHAVR